MTFLRSTCCQLKDGQQGCCPLPNAVCCNDQGMKNSFSHNQKNSLPFYFTNSFSFHPFLPFLPSPFSPFFIIFISMFPSPLLSTRIRLPGNWLQKKCRWYEEECLSFPDLTTFSLQILILKFWNDWLSDGKIFRFWMEGNKIITVFGMVTEFFLLSPQWMFILFDHWCNLSQRIKNHSIHSMQVDCVWKYKIMYIKWMLLRNDVLGMIETRIEMWSLMRWWVM